MSSSVVEEIYYSLLKERTKLLHSIESNKERIKEIDTFAKLSESKEEDLKVFSPRTLPTNVLSQIEQEKKEKISLINTNAEYENRCSVIEKQVSELDQIMNLLSNLSNDNSVESDKFDGNEYQNAISIQEFERQRIASELHDSTVQSLTHLVHSLELCSLFMDQDPIRAKLELETSMNTLRKSINEIREIIFNIRPMAFDDLNFDEAVSNLIGTLQGMYPSIHFESSIPRIIANSDLLLIVYRIIQEAIINACKNSECSKISVYFKDQNSSFAFCVNDDGKGFDSDYDYSVDMHFGLKLMKERSHLIESKLEIISENEKGSTIVLNVPKRLISVVE